MLRILIFLISSLFLQPSFRTEQKKNARVKTAYQEKYESLKSALDAMGIKPGELNICFRVLKKEQKLEVWAKKASAPAFTFFKSYPVCASSGELGPKRRGGDGQVPEGFYHIDRFNPYSNFYLSLGVSYPNTSDRILGYKKNLGGDIFIHGSCVTIGCMPLTDDLIKEVYVLAVEAKASGQGKIQCMIFPGKMNDALLALAKNDAALKLFWENLRKGYDLFEKHKKIPAVKVETDGSCIFTMN